MAILKRPDLFDASQPLLQFLDDSKNLIALIRIACFRLSFGEPAQLGVDLLSFGERVKESGKERSFLRRNLGGGCIVCNRWIMSTQQTLERIKAIHRNRPRPKRFPFH